MNNTTEFITDFMVWVTQFVVVSTVLSCSQKSRAT
jgi:hypothetical protein